MNEDDDGPDASDIWPPVGEDFRFSRTEKEEMLKMLVRPDINKTMGWTRSVQKFFVMQPREFIRA